MSLYLFMLVVSDLVVPWHSLHAMCQYVLLFSLLQLFLWWKNVVTVYICCCHYRYTWEPRFTLVPGSLNMCCLPSHTALWSTFLSALRRKLEWSLASSLCWLPTVPAMTHLFPLVGDLLSITQVFLFFSTSVCVCLCVYEYLVVIDGIWTCCACPV